MDALRQILEMDRTDCEISGLALDTLCNITDPKTFDDEGNVESSKQQECSIYSFHLIISSLTLMTLDIIFSG